MCHIADVKIETYQVIKKHYRAICYNHVIATLCRFFLLRFPVRWYNLKNQPDRGNKKEVIYCSRVLVETDRYVPVLCTIH